MLRRQTIRILVIDDDSDALEIVFSCLREESYQVLSALTAEEGLKLFILSRPDLVLLDILFPGPMSGFDALKRFRSINPSARVVMLTANTDPERVREALELGALAYVDKPFDFGYLKRVVAMALQTELTQPNEPSTT